MSVPIRPDEILLWRIALWRETERDRLQGDLPRELAFMDELAERLHGIHPKRTNYILEKWSWRWWECGVSTRSGWLTDKGKARARELLGPEGNR